jgi:hypothetical protein
MMRIGPGPRAIRQAKIVVVALVLALIVAALLLVLAQEPVGATFPGGNGKIVFADVGDNDPFYMSDHDVWSINPDGSGLMNLTAGSAVSGNDVAISPDGTKIIKNGLHNGSYGTWIMNINGTSFRRIANNNVGVSYSWSPDGRRIAYDAWGTVDGKEVPAIYTMKSDGTDHRLLTEGSRPDWSPNGELIAYDKWIDVPTANNQGTVNIFVIPTSGGTPQQITNVDYAVLPSWAPSSSRIAFLSNNDIFTVVLGQQPTAITEYGPDSVKTPSQPVFSPDGTKIAFREWNFDFDTETQIETIYTVASDGGALTEVTSTLTPTYGSGVANNTSGIDWQPTGVPTLDLAPPSVVAASPTGTKVAPSANVTATFSEAMAASTVNGTTLKLVRKGTTKPVKAKITYSASTRKAVLNPSASLVAGATYTATVTSGARDLAGNALDQSPGVAGNQSKVWTFKVRR